jgi:hypothetical protein
VKELRSEIRAEIAAAQAENPARPNEGS